MARIIKTLAVYILSNRLFSKPYGDLSDAPVLAGRVLLEQSLKVFFLVDIMQYFADFASAYSHLPLCVLAMFLHRFAPGLSPLQEFFCQVNARCRNLAWLPFVHF